ncbi:phenazine biosynthesis protein PhzE [Myceligenerans cantabricum]
MTLTPERFVAALDRPDPPPFAVLRRESDPGKVDYWIGACTTADRLADLTAAPATTPHLALVPYRQVHERGYEAHDDGTPLTLVTPVERGSCPVGRFAEAVAHVPAPERVGPGVFDLSDDEYARAVERVLREEVEGGEGANFVLSRGLRFAVDGWRPQQALPLLVRLLSGAPSAYWTFAVHTGERTLVGASPERHITLRDGTATMNPISGTYRHPAGGPDQDELLAFLADTKEARELAMVVDEELKIMGDVCRHGGRVAGPFLKEAPGITHTEYYLSGETDLVPGELLRRSMMAPTVVGGPLENACRVIARHETGGRGYYAGIMALVEDGGRPSLDSAILIRTADIGNDGTGTIRAGATLVAESDPAAEAAETRAKGTGLLRLLSDPTTRAAAEATDVAGSSRVERALRHRNDVLAPLWFAEPARRRLGPGPLDGLRLLVIDGEDTFTAMARHVLAGLGMDVTVCRHDDVPDLDGYDAAVLGPGPGNPLSFDDPKIVRMRSLAATLLGSGRPFLAVCLGHQLVAQQHGLDLHRHVPATQGRQEVIDLWGRSERVGFYNSFVAASPDDTVASPRGGTAVVDRDPVSGVVHGLRGPGYTTVQFHPASILTPAGQQILREAFEHALATASRRPDGRRDAPRTV